MKLERAGQGRRKKLFSRQKVRFLFGFLALVCLALAAALLPGILRYEADTRSARELGDLEGLSRNELLAINPDYVCTIRFPDAGKSYPVVRGRDNESYLHTSFWGEESELGCIYMDFRCQEEDAHVLVYGHDAASVTGERIMFGFLRQYLAEDYLRENARVQIITGDELRSYEVFSARVCRTDGDVYELHAERDRAFEDYRERMEAPEGARQVLTLSTCFGEIEELRMVVQAALVDEDR